MTLLTKRQRTNLKKQVYDKGFIDGVKFQKERQE